MDEGEKRIGRPPIGERAMTGAERIAKWRAKHARRVARRTPYVPQPPTMDWLESLLPKPGELTFTLDDE
jgi:hypothetical protein